MTEFKIISKPFSWNDNFSEEALEDFDTLREKLGKGVFAYNVSCSIGTALAKLKILEEQGAKVDESKLKEDEL